MCWGESGETCTANAFNSSEVTGKKCNVQVTVGGRVFTRTAMTLPGEAISWTAILSFRIADDSDREHLVSQLKRKDHQEEEEVHYMPPRMEHGTFHQAILVRQGNVIEAEEGPPLVLTSEPAPQSEEVKVVVEHADVGFESREVEREESLVPEMTTSSVDVEEAGDREGGSGDSEVKGELSVESISSEEPRHKLAEATQADTTLATAKALADKEQEGYYWADGLVFRTRLDRLGDNLEQLYLPAQYRNKCLRMSHENFGHTGCNKMGEHIRRYFYWLSITADSIKHIKSCLVCQKKDKSNPRPMTMQAREIVTVPSECVAINIVGPFPVSKGGFGFLLTYLDMATRWPEAIPLRKTTTKIVIEQLTLVFSRCGFPMTLISDNGPQFVATAFQKWLKDKGITHVRVSPYHPQGNGVVERMHRTLTNVIARCTDGKGNGAQIVPMAMYFLRCMPSRATGLSPFRAKHGWEPTTPLQILYKGWMQRDLGPVDLEEWTTVNAERVQHAREVVMVNLQSSSDERKKQWDKKAQTRQFEKGNQVFLRKSGLNTKLADSWEGPFVVEKRNMPLSYRINTGYCTLPSQDDSKVQRVTSVLEPDTMTGQMDNQYAEAKVTGSVVTEDRQKDIRCWEEEYKDILTKEPGLTTLKQFRIDTGDHAPIHQRPYKTPQSLIESTNKELDWLKLKRYIRPSEIPWTSPMVTVRKPDGTARLCVDFKAINAITEPIPFYMPRVEEVLESVGKSSIISKLDLTKGCYQVPMHPDDIKKTAFMCHQGRFEFLRMPFGIMNAPAVFQEMMQGLFRDYSSFCSPYMNHLVIFSSSWEDYVQHVRQVLDKLRTAGLMANPAKCHWGGTRMEFLGHLVGDGTMSLPQHRVKALATY